MSKNTQLPIPVKKDLQKSSISLGVANLVLLGSIAAWYHFSLSYALAQAWGQAAFYFCIGTLMIWLFAPHIVLNCIEIYVNASRSNRDFGKIDRVLSTGLQILRLMRIRNSAAVASILVRLGQARLVQGFYDSAVLLFQEAITYSEKISGVRESIAMSMYHLNLGSAYAWQQKYMEAEIQAEKAVEILQQIDTPLSKDFEAHCNLHIGASRVELNELESAETHLKSALEALEKMKPSFDMPLLTIKHAVISCCLYLARLKVKQGNSADSFEYDNKFFEEIQGNTAILSPNHARALNSLAGEYITIGNFSHAEDLLNVAYELGRENPFHPDSQETISAFEKLLVATDRQAEIADMRSWLRPFTAIATM